MKSLFALYAPPWPLAAMEPGATPKSTTGFRARATASRLVKAISSPSAVSLGSWTRGLGKNGLHADYERLKSTQSGVADADSYGGSYAQTFEKTIRLSARPARDTPVAKGVSPYRVAIRSAGNLSCGCQVTFGDIASFGHATLRWSPFALRDFRVPRVAAAQRKLWGVAFEN